MGSSSLPRVLALPRNIDFMPPGGREAFASSFGTVPNDGAWHSLSEPTAQGVPPFQLAPTDRLRISFVRVEWSTVDLTVPPPLTLRLLVQGQLSVALSALSSLMLLPLAIGTPAAELTVYAEVAPGFQRITPQVMNTGAVAQLVAVMFSGWSYPQTLPDGAGYASLPS